MITILGYVGIMWVLINYLKIIFRWLDKEKWNKYLCLKCFSFIFTIVLTFNPFVAGLASMIGFILDKYLLKEEIKL